MSSHSYWDRLPHSASQLLVPVVSSGLASLVAGYLAQERRPVAPGLALWLAASSLAGPGPGLARQAIRHSPGRQRLIALGTAFGLLAGQGAYLFVQAAFVWIWPLDAFLWGKNVSGGGSDSAVHIAQARVRTGRISRRQRVDLAPPARGQGVT